MEEKKPNDTNIDVEMIIKALECMAGITQRDCDSCSFMVDKFCSDTELSKATLDLINRLQRENANVISMNDTLYREKEELKSNKFANWKMKFFNLKDEYERKLEEGELVSIDWHNEQVLHANAEIERLKDEKYQVEQNLKQCENGYELELHTARFDMNINRERVAELQKQVDELKDICLDCPYKLKFDEIEKQAVKDTKNSYTEKIKQAKCSMVVMIDEYKKVKEKETNDDLKNRWIGLICGLHKGLEIIKGVEVE